MCLIGCICGWPALVFHQVYYRRNAFHERRTGFKTWTFVGEIGSQWLLKRMPLSKRKICVVEDVGPLCLPIPNCSVFVCCLMLVPHLSKFEVKSKIVDGMVLFHKFPDRQLSWHKYTCYIFTGTLFCDSKTLDPKTHAPWLIALNDVKFHDDPLLTYWCLERSGVLRYVTDTDDRTSYDAFYRRSSRSGR